MNVTMLIELLHITYWTISCMAEQGTRWSKECISKYSHDDASTVDLGCIVKVVDYERLKMCTFTVEQILLEMFNKYCLKVFQ